MDKSTKKRATITQVAKHAGVSVGTVSNYLNGTAGVSHDRAARIQQAIDVLDYIPDTLASSLRRKDSTAIHVLTPHLDSAFYTNTISALMHDAYEAGYTVHISGYEYSSEIERQQLRALQQRLLKALQQKRPQLRAQKKALQQKKQQAMFYPMQIMLQQIWTAK